MRAFALSALGVLRQGLEDCDDARSRTAKRPDVFASVMGTLMRVFAVASLTVVLLGVGAFFAVADAEQKQTFQSDRAFQRLELQAELEQFYDSLAIRAANLSEAERIALYREAEAELTRKIVSAPGYAGRDLPKGLAYLDQAKVWLAYRLGLSAEQLAQG